MSRKYIIDFILLLILLPVVVGATVAERLDVTLRTANPSIVVQLINDYVRHLK